MSAGAKNVMLSEKAKYKFYMYSMIPAVCIRLNNMKLSFFVGQMIEYRPFHVIQSHTCIDLMTVKRCVRG